MMFFLLSFVSDSLPVHMCMHIQNAGLVTPTVLHKHISISHSTLATRHIHISLKTRYSHQELNIVIMFCHCCLSASTIVGLVLPGKISDVPLVCSVCGVLSNFSTHSASCTLPCRSIRKSGKGRCCAVFLYYAVSLGVHRAH